MIPPRGYRLELLADGKEWLTANQRLFWRERGRRTKQWREYAAAKAIELKIPPMQYARVIAELRFSDKRRRDPANWAPTAKACVDGLVDAGIFPDDNHKFLVGPDMRMGPTVVPAWRSLHLIIYPISGTSTERSDA